MQGTMETSSFLRKGTSGPRTKDSNVMTRWVGGSRGPDLEIVGCTTPPEIENRARVSGLQPDFESRRLY